MTREEWEVRCWNLERENRELKKKFEQKDALTELRQSVDLLNLDYDNADKTIGKHLLDSGYTYTPSQNGIIFLTSVWDGCKDVYIADKKSSVVLLKVYNDLSTETFWFPLQKNREYYIVCNSGCFVPLKTN